jgi:hypothetical protein
MPVITGVTETISKSLRQYLRNILGKNKITAESANVKYKTNFTGEITLHVEQTVHTEQLQHCIP